MSQVISLHPEPPNDNPIAFLDAIEKSLEHGRALKRSETLEKLFFASVSEDNWYQVFARISRLLARVNWCVLVEKTEPTKPTEQDRSDENRLAKNIIDALISQDEERDSLTEKAAQRGFSKFPPAYQYLDAFDGIFGNDSPLDYINEALSILSPKTPYTHPDDCWYDDGERFKLDQEQLNFLVTDLFVPLFLRHNGIPGQGLIGETTLPELLPQLGRKLLEFVAKGFQSLLTDKASDFKLLKFDIASFSPNDSKQIEFSEKLEKIEYVEEFLSFIFKPGNIYLPQGLLVAIVRRILDDDWVLGGETAASSVGFHLLSWPIGEPQTYWVEIQEGLFDPAWLKNLQARYKTPVDVPFLPCRMLASNLYQLYENIVVFYDSLGDDNYTYIMKKYSGKLCKLSDSRLGGGFPWTPEEDPGNWYYYSIAPFAAWYLLLLLEVATAEEEGVREGEPFTGDIYGDNMAEGFHSLKIYSYLYNEASRVGLPKLGNALFSFYLIRKILRSQWDATPPNYDWLSFSSQLKLCLDSPGADWVKKSIHLSKVICKQNGWQISELKLDNIPVDIPSFPVNAEAIERIDENIINLGCTAEIRLANDYRPHWGLLSERVRRMLSHAEARFERDSKGLGKTETDYGGIAVDYARIFEIELDERLKDVFLETKMQSFLVSQVKGWRSDEKPTLGQYIMMMNKYEKMPSTLQERIRQKVGSLPNQKQLIGELRKLKDIRNDGAHTVGVSASKLTEIRELIFSKKFLQRFLESIADCYQSKA